MERVKLRYFPKPSPTNNVGNTTILNNKTAITDNPVDPRTAWPQLTHNGSYSFADCNDI